MDFFQPSMRIMWPFFDHLLEDVLGLMQDSPPVIALREVGYNSIGMFLDLPLDIYWNELAYTEFFP